MYRIIIADDEAVECRALEMMIQSDFEKLEVLPCASNGIELIANVEKYRPDIAIVDINMPGMNGLDALEVIRGRNRRMKIVISSAYSEFQYAKRAMELGAVDYILKPLNRSVFREALEKVILRLEQERKILADQKAAEVQTHEMNAVLADEFLSSLMLGEPNETTFRMLLRSFEQDYNGCVLVTVKGLSDRVADTRRIRELQHEITEEMNQFCRCIGKSYKGELCFLIFLSSNVTGKERKKWFSDVVGILRSAAARRGFDKLVFGVSSWQMDAAEMAAGLAESRMVARSQGKPGIYFYAAKEKSDRPQDWSQLTELCVQAVREGKLEECEAAVHKSLESRAPSVEDMDEVCIAVMESLFPVCESLMEEQDYILRYVKTYQIDWSTLMECQDALELEQWILETLKRLSHRAEVRAGYGRGYIERAIIFMEHHYTEDISLEQTASDVGISSFYLSRLLKQALNQNFVEILTAIRMRRALALVWEGKSTVKEIAVQSGYGNITYFYKVFRKYTGKGIGEMREYLE